MGLFYTAREKSLNDFKEQIIFLKKIEPELEPEAKSKYRKFSLKLHEEFLNKIVNEEKKYNSKNI